MSHDRAEELYERALELEPGARARFLREACAGDAALEEELNSLLEHAAPAEAMFASLAGAVTAPPADAQVGPYQLVGILGAGGMGTVYKAYDPRLDRMVALKFLPLFTGAGSRAEEQFLVEARAAASLEHPNVCTVHEVGTTPDGRPFIAMACYEGETLRERLDRGPLSIPEAREVASQVARGLGAAHARGIIHRDVKPGNIMLCSDGTVRLLDFGLAKMSDVSMTAPGATPGTIAYMSPEQARGDSLTPQTDLWSLGVVLFEMVTGVRPFRGGNDRVVLEAIQHDSPATDRQQVFDQAPWLARIVDRLLQKDPGSRYSSVSPLLTDLAQDVPSGPTDRIGIWIRSNRLAAMAVGAGVLVLAFAVPALLRDQAAVPASETRGVSVAVLPFTVRGAGLDVWKEGVVDLLSRGLDGAAGIHAIDSRTVLAAWRANVPDPDLADLEQSLAVARRAQANRALLGSAVAAGTRIRLSATVRDAVSGEAIGSAEVEGPQDSILSLVDRLGMQALEFLAGENSMPHPALDVARITTSSLLALKEYLEGEAAYRRSDYTGAIRAWERAVRADTLFALGYLSLTDAYGWTSGSLSEQELSYQQALRRAAALEERLPGRERALVRARLGRETGSSTSYAGLRQAIERYPDAAQLWYELGEHYMHDPRVMGNPAQIEDAFRHAAELQPAVTPLRIHLIEIAFRWHGDSAHIAQELAAYVPSGHDDLYGRAGRIAYAFTFGDAAARREARASIGALDSESALQVFSYMSHPAFARQRDELFDPIRSRVGQDRIGPLLYRRAMTLSLVDGRAAEALEVLEDAAMPRDAQYCGPFYLSQRGFEVPRQTLEQRASMARSDSLMLLGPTEITCAAGYAARLEDWETFEAVLGRARQQSRNQTASGDSAGARSWDLAERTGEAYGLDQRGRKAEALRTIERVQAERGSWALVWNIGQLAFELGQMEKAAQAYRALWGTRDGVPARLQLARILERTGRLAEAREAYRFVADAWRNADAGLRPVVAEARQAVARLSVADGVSEAAGATQ